MDKIGVDMIRRYYPSTQGIYLFGSHDTDDERPESDVDIAVLLPVNIAGEAGSLRLSECAAALARHLGRHVDLVNLRFVSTVFQHEIIQHGRLLYNPDMNAVYRFEMMVMSLYQKLNEERAGIMRAFLETKRAYPV